MRSGQLLWLLPLLHTVLGQCPVQLHPPKVVVRYGDPVSVNCIVSGNHQGIGWIALEGPVNTKEDVQSLTWTVENLKNWNTEPKCYVNFTNGGEPDDCEQALQVILYKTPDSVSISSVGPMVEGRQYHLQCEVQNIAPVQNLIVKWYRGETLQNETSFNDPTKTPVNVSSTLIIMPSRADDGAQYSCVAELNLGPEGPQPPPKVNSEPLNITVYFEECPIQLHPPTVVVRYGDPVSANCNVSGGHLGVSWAASDGSVDMKEDVQFVTWRVENLTDWDIEKKCFVHFNNGRKIDECKEVLQVILYKSPDSVSISVLNHTGPMEEGRQYQLQCEVQNIAPVQNLTVKWYRGGTLQNETSFNDLTKTPVSVSSTFTITPSRADDGAQYSCVAELDLGPEGPQPPLKMKSEPLSITVYLAECPIQLHPPTVVVRYGDPVSVNCTVSVDHLGIHWEALEGSVDLVTDKKSVTWTENLIDWNIEPKCFVNFTNGGEPDECEEALQVILYKSPDSVSINILNNTSLMVEGRQYQLQCEVQNIAPVQNLIVKWYRGETLQNATSFNDLTKTPVSVSSTFTITPSTADDRAQYSCVAELDLGPEGPQPSPKVKSEPLNITVYWEKCPIQLHPPTVVVRYGEAVSVNCTVSVHHLGIGWEASEGSVDMVTGVQSVTWGVENLTDWHIEPKCFGNFMNGTGIHQCEKGLQVILYKTPNSVSISSVDLMVEGRQYQLQCEVQNIAGVQYLTVKWYRGETLQSETSFNDLTKTPVSVSSTLMITPSTADDGAQYSCVAELDLGPEGPQPPPKMKSKPLNMTVHYAPQIMDCPNQKELREGDSLHAVPFRAVGNPAPTVTWYRNHAEVNSSTPLSRRDVGQYVLTARNDLGSAHCTLNLTVGYAPMFTCNHSYNVTVKESYTLNCTVEGYPVPKVTWFKEGRTVEPLAHLDRTDAGQYSIIAENKYGTANPTLEINVLYAPQIKDCPKQTELREDESLDAVPLKAEGNPAPTVTWYRNHAEVNSSTPLSRRDVGQYVLTARNDLGSTNCTLTLTVGSSPPASFLYYIIVIVVAVLVILAILLALYIKSRKSRGYYDFSPVHSARSGDPNGIPMTPLISNGTHAGT